MVISSEPGASAGYTNANGGHFKNEGEFNIDFFTKSGRPRHITFQNADVSMPIISIGKLTDAEHEVTFTATGGRILHLKSGEIDEFIRLHGVYWIELNVDETLLKPGGGTTEPGKNVSLDFLEAGAP